MKTLSAILVLLIATVLLTVAAMHNPGYVLIERKPWSIEMPLTLFGLLLVALVTALYFALHLTMRLLRIPRDVGRWRIDRRVRHLQKALHTGLIKILEGNHSGAEKDLVGDIKVDDVPGIHYLAAALAAQGQGHTEQRDEYLTQAQKTPGLALGSGLLQAHLHEAAHEYERSLATLNGLRVSHPGNRTVLRLLAQRARGLRDWTLLTQLIPELRRYKAMEPSAINEIEREAYRQLLLVATSHATDDTDTVWRSVPKNHRQHPTLIALYAHALIQRESLEEAERLLLAALRHDATDELFKVYGELHGKESLRFLSQAETWLKTHLQSSALLLCLAQLSLAANLPGKAREYAERCARQNPSADTFAELTQVMERLDDPVRAREYCHRSLELHRIRTETPRPEEFFLPLSP